MERRNSFEIEADILSIARVGALKTHIVYKANLNFCIVKRYLARLVGSGLLQEDGKRYYTTERGEDYIKALSVLRGI